MKRILFVVMFLVFATSAWAGFDEGLDAARRGDFATALREWRPLAEGGDARAQYGLGYMYQNGTGVPQSDAEAAKWFRLAAEQGDVMAQYNLAFLYYKGSGMSRDDVQAHLWFSLSASNARTDFSRERAEDMRRKVAARMTPAQITEAERLARGLKPKAGK